MNVRKLNWPIWVGFLLSVFAFISYPFIFVWFAITRDFPWANLLFFALALVFLFYGMRRAWAAGRPHPKRSKIFGTVMTVLCVAMLGLFIFVAFIGARFLPASSNAPQVSQKAPDFTLSDTNGKQVALSELLSSPVNGNAPKGVLLVFYRGYW